MIQEVLYRLLVVLHFRDYVAFTQRQLVLFSKKRKKKTYIKSDKILSFFFFMYIFIYMAISLPWALQAWCLKGDAEYGDYNIC